MMGCCLCVLLCSCSSAYNSNGEQNYLSSKNGQALVVPPGLSEENISHFHDLPTPNASPAFSIEP
jgi:uncharacterized lipoprotein